MTDGRDPRDRFPPVKADRGLIDPREIDWSKPLPLRGLLQILGSMKVSGQLMVTDTGSIIIGAEALAGTDSQLHIHSVLEHIALFEKDGANYPDDAFIYDINSDIARMFWFAPYPTAVRVLDMHQDGQVDFLAGTGAAVASCTAAGLRGIEVWSDTEAGGRTFTNTGYLDLDALTGGAGTSTAVLASVATGTRALVTINAELANDTDAAFTLLSYRISGATTLAASDTWSAYYKASAAGASGVVSRSRVHTGLTAGTNEFEVQARVLSGTGTVQKIDLVVVPL